MTRIALVLLVLSGCATGTDLPDPAVSGGAVDADAMRTAMVEAADGAKFPGLSACIFTADATTWCAGR